MLVAGVEVTSVTELTCFRRCPREHYLRYGLRREPRGPKSEALSSGKLVHQALGQHDRGEPVDLASLRPELRALVRGHMAYYGSPDATFQCDRTDVAFQVYVSPNVAMVGEFDGFGRNRKSGQMAILEYKTSSQDITLGSPYWQQVAVSDAQVTAYLDAALIMGLGRVEVLYDVLKKPDIRRKLATPVEARKYTKATEKEPSRLYAGQTDKDETEEEYETRVLEDIVSRPTHYYQRGVVVRLEHEHVAHRRDILGTVHLMQASRELGESVPRNTDSCFKYGRPCDFWPVCLSGVDVMDETLYQKRDSHKKFSAAAPPEPAEPAKRFVF